MHARVIVPHGFFDGGKNLIKQSEHRAALVHSPCAAFFGVSYLISCQLTLALFSQINAVLCDVQVLPSLS